MTKQVFLNKGFYFHRSKRENVTKFKQSAELIKLFGGKIEQFLEKGVNYVLTDVSRSEWPPYAKITPCQQRKDETCENNKELSLDNKDGILENNNTTLERAVWLNIKLMSLDDLLKWCSKYISSQSSSDDDEEIRAAIREIKPPFIKVEDINSHYAPSVKEFAKWPEINVTPNLRVGKSFFCDSLNLLNGTPNQSPAPTTTNNNMIHYNNNSAQLTQQATSLKNTTTTATNQNTLPAQRGVRRRHSVFCEICNLKITEKIDEHIQTEAHKTNTEKLNWTEVSSVIESLPSLSTLNMRRLTNLTPPNGIEHQEFLCLHKVESVSQLFNGLN